MLRILLSVAVLALASCTAFSQNINFADTSFKSALLDHSPVIDTNSDGEISIAEAAAFSGSLSLQYGSITDLSGIEYFLNIIGLNITGNGLTSIDLSSNSVLEEFSCGANQLTSLDMSGNPALRQLSCPQNQISSLDISSNINLEFLACGTNNLSSLDLSNNLALTDLYCFVNSLTSLNISQNTSIEFINCSENYSLSSLVVGDNPSLVFVRCNDNNIQSLDLSGCSALEELYCNDNELEYLNIANGNNQNMTDLAAYDNPNLTCIQVDDVAYSNANWESGSIFDPFQYDDIVSFSEFCENTTSVNEYDYSKHQYAYPNPAIGSLNFGITTNVRLTTITGQHVITANNVNSIDLSDLTSGIYLLTYLDKAGNSIGSERIVKD